MVERKFNHDLCVSADDQELAKTRWPRIWPALVNPDLVVRFARHETVAKRFKQAVQVLGSISVLLASSTLFWALARLAFSDLQRLSRLDVTFEVLGVFGFAIALVVSRFGPLRRRWLKHRFFAETIRRWHFMKMLDGRPIEKLASSPDHARDYLANRSRDFTAFLADLDGSVGQKMDRMRESDDDPLSGLMGFAMPADPATRAELVEAYRTLRLDHQLDFATYKLSPDDRNFLFVPLILLRSLSAQIASATVIAALLVSLLVLGGNSSPALSPLALALTLLALTVRAWRDGMATDVEVENYKAYRYRLALLRPRWQEASDDRGQLAVAHDVEGAAVGELRSFLSAHENAQFLI